MKLILCLFLLSLSLFTYARSSHSQRHQDHRPLKYSLYKKSAKVPVAHLRIDRRKCMSPCQVTFDGTKSKAFKGEQIKKYYFNFGDGETLTTESPIVTHVYHANPSKKHGKSSYLPSLTVTDTLGKKSRKDFKKLKVYKGTEVQNDPPESIFSFTPQTPKINEVIQLSSLSQDDKGIVSYEWEVSDGRNFKGQEVDISFATAGTYTVLHRVRDAEGLSSEFTNIIHVIPDTINPELLVEFSGIATDSFNPLDLSVTVRPLNGRTFGNLNQYELYLNGLTANVRNFNFTSEEITFTIAAIDGKNTLSIDGVDSDNVRFSSSIDFYAGSRNLTVDIPISGASGTLVIYPGDDKSYKVNLSFENGLAHITNVPSIDLVIDASTDASLFGYALLPKESSSAVIEMLPNRTPSTVDNDDFSKGADGWTVTGGTPVIVDKIVKNEIVPNDVNLRIYTDETEDLTLSRSFFVQEENKSVVVNFNYVGSPNEDLHVFLRNESTGEFVHEIFEGKNSEDLTAFFDISKKVLVHSESVGDVIHLDIIKKYRPIEVSYLKTFFDFIISEAVAQIGPEINRYLDIDQITYIRGQIFNNSSSNATAGFEARSWYYEVPSPGTCTNGDSNYLTDKLFVSKSPLTHLSVGFLPSYVTSELYSLYTSFTFGERVVNPRDPEETIFQALNFERAHLYIVQRGEEISRFSLSRSSVHAFPHRSRNLNRYDRFSFNPIDIASFTTRSNLTLVLEVESEGKIYYEELRTPLTPLRWYNRENTSRGCTDTIVGGAKWATADTINSLDAIFDITNAEDRRGFLINDISKLNGGNFPPHGEHQNGHDVDYLTTGYRDGLYASVSAPADIHHVLSKAGELTNVKSILITVDHMIDEDGDGRKERYVSTGAVDKVVRARCTDNNYLFKDIFEQKPDHHDHGHITFSRGARREAIAKESFPEFLPFFIPLLLTRSISLKAYYPNAGALQGFIWEIRRNGETVDVIDENWSTDPNPVGRILEASQNLSSVKYSFPPEGGDYSIYLVGIDLNGRCMTKSFNFNIPPGSTPPDVSGPMFASISESEPDDEGPGYCDDEWQTYRGNEIVDPVSGHVHLAGAVISEKTILEAGRFYVDVGIGEEVLICGESEIRDNYSSSNACPEWQSKEECASIYIKGTVDAQNTVFDARNGKIRVAGVSGAFLNTPLILANDPENGVGLDENETSLDDTTIAPVNNSTVTLFNVDMFGVDIKDKAFIQQSIVYKAILEGEPTILGASVFIVEEDEEEVATVAEEEVEETPPPTLKISGKSLIEGLVYSTANIEIDESTVGKKGAVSGGARVSKSLVEGKIWGNTSADDGRVEIVDSILFEGSKLLNASKALNKSFVGAVGETGDSGPLVWGNVVIDNGVRLSGESVLSDTTVLNGDNLIGHKVIASKNTKIDSTIGGGSRDNLFITNSQFVDASITGTPFISNSFFFRKVFVSEDPVILKSTLTTFIDGVGSVRVSGSATIANSLVYAYKRNSNVADNASVLSESGVFDSSMYENAILSSDSHITNTTLGGSVHVTNKCDLYFGYWTEGLIVPGDGSPCGVIPGSTEPALAMRTMASTSTLSVDEATAINSEEDLKSKVSSLNKLKIKKPKKLRKNNERLIRGIRKNEAALEKRLMSLSRSKQREPASLDEIKALHKRSLEYVEKVKAETKLKTAR